MAVVTSETSGGLALYWGATHRTGYCEVCGTRLIQDPNPEEKRVRQNFCPACDSYQKGVLISRQAMIPVPEAPTCLTPKCLTKYFLDSLRYVLIANYHARRVAYAEANRHNKILERYRTGEPSPETIWQAIHANWKLACPVCRKYNVDPLLFKKGE